MVWKNKTWPILGRREETGIPKIYADIEDLHIIPQNYYTGASYEGNTFLRLEMFRARPVDRQTLAKIQSLQSRSTLLHGVISPDSVALERI